MTRILIPHRRFPPPLPPHLATRPGNTVYIASRITLMLSGSTKKKATSDDVRDVLFQQTKEADRQESKAREAVRVAEQERGEIETTFEK